MVGTYTLPDASMTPDGQSHDSAITSLECDGRHWLTLAARQPYVKAQLQICRRGLCIGASHALHQALARFSLMLQVVGRTPCPNVQCWLCIILNDVTVKMPAGALQKRSFESVQTYIRSLLEQGIRYRFTTSSSTHRLAFYPCSVRGGNTLKPRTRALIL